METKLYVIVATPRKQDIPQVVTNFTFEGHPVFCGGSGMLDRARFFKSYEEAQTFNLDKVLPLLDTKLIVSYVRPCNVVLNW